jgi:predicted phage terminase large subunit-like protein
MRPLTQAIEINQVALLARIKQRCEDDFGFCARYLFKARKGTKFIFNDHHQIIADDLMAVYRGEIQNYILNVPPRYSKTELVIIMFTVWCYIKNARCEFIHLSYAHPLVLENSDSIREIIKSTEFRQLWPELSIRLSKDAKGAWATQENGQFYATQAGGAVTGFGAGRMDEYNPETGKYVFSGALLIDDPLKPDDARHDNVRKAINRRWEETIKSRRNSPRTPTILTMQRIHEDDFTAELLKDTDMKWFVRSMPAIVDEGLETERALWPAKHDLPTLKAMKKKSAYAFSGQYNQKPTPPGGDIIKGMWFRRYKMLPRLKYRKIYVDTAQKTQERHDYSVFETWGMGVDGGIYLLDLKRDKWEAPELLRNALDFWNKHKAADPLLYGALRQMRIEDKVSGTGLIQSIKKKGTIPVYAQQRNRDKFMRSQDVTPFLESGCVWIPEDAPWVEEFISECESFTADDSHAFDDQIDPMFDAVDDMLGGTNPAQLWENMS